MTVLSATLRGVVRLWSSIVDLADGKLTHTSSQVGTWLGLRPTSDGSHERKQVPVVYPVIDYSDVLNYPAFGGGFSFKTNFVKLSRDAAVFDPITTLANTNSLCHDGISPIRADAIAMPAAGLHRRLIAEAQWRKSFTDPIGQIWTPLASLRADAINSSSSNQLGVSNYPSVGDTQAFRLMPPYARRSLIPWASTRCATAFRLAGGPHH
ncbi:LPS assembly protein LptD [Bradyrhizobium sp. NC92]|uniref:LPS assembly protein LptD n=1 Tax=Bradyrhizobium sp. (strain NC92) TaxID=55395 RepID=UPI0021A9BDE1|nr:LPS assembly protein LptD [Bradyrhizobium sp. NC92]UWU67755.1 LPS assembly protein LptD [Bradyrhizobium sp. NC92]